MDRNERFSSLSADLQRMDYGEPVPVRDLPTDETMWVALPLATVEELVKMVLLFGARARRERFDGGPVTLPLATAKTPRELYSVLKGEEDGAAERRNRGE